MKKQPNSEMCFICGRSNPAGLYMRFYSDGDDSVVSHYTVPSQYQGYPGIVHGGIQAAMLDEVVGRIGMIGDHHRFMMSVTLDVKYRHPVPVGVPLKVTGRILRLKTRLGRAEGRIELPDGTVACEAAMTLANVPPELLQHASPALLNWKVD